MKLPLSGTRAATRVVAVLLVLAGSCAPAEKNDAPPAKGAPQTAASAGATTRVRMNLTPSISNGQIMIAKEEGYFAAEGLDVEFMEMDLNAANLAIGTGQLDVYSAPLRTGVFNLIARGEPVQIVADKGRSAPGPCVPEAFTADPETTARIAAKGGSFKGERIALVKGGIMEYLVDRALERDQLQRSDIEEVQLPQGDWASSSSRQVDAVRFMMEPVLSSALARGAKVVAPIEDIAPGTQLAMIVYGRRLLRDEPEVGERFMRAYLRGVHRYAEGKTESNVAIIARQTKLEPDVVRRACWPQFAPDGRIEERAIAPFLQWARQKGYLTSEIPVSAWWNSRFVDAASRAAAPAR